MIKRTIARVVGWIARANSEQDGVPSFRRYNASAVVAAVLLFCAYDVAAHKGLRSESITLATAALTGTLALLGATYKQ